MPLIFHSFFYPVQNLKIWVDWGNSSTKKVVAKSFVKNGNGTFITTSIMRDKRNDAHRMKKGSGDWGYLFFMTKLESARKTNNI